MSALSLLVIPLLLIFITIPNNYCTATRESNEWRKDLRNGADSEVNLFAESPIPHERDDPRRIYFNFGTDSNSDPLPYDATNGESEENSDENSDEIISSLSTMIPFPTPRSFGFELESDESRAIGENEALSATNTAEEGIKMMEDDHDETTKYHSSDAAIEKKLNDDDVLLSDGTAEANREFSSMEESSQPPASYSQEEDANEYEGETDGVFLEPVTQTEPTQSDTSSLEQFTTENVLQEIFAQNINILRVTINKERIERNGSVTVINQEEDIYYVESVLTLTNADSAHRESGRPTSRLFYSQSNVRIGNITKENATRCEYTNGATFYYDPMHLLRYPVHVQTADDGKMEHFGQYRKLTALYFNCPLHQKCCELDCCQLSDKDIIAKKFRIFAVFDETASMSVLSEHVAIKHKGARFKLAPSFEYSIVSHKIPNNSTIRTQCEYKLSEFDDDLFEDIVMENGESIKSIFETFVAPASCVANGACCGIFCCRTLPQVNPLQQTTEAEPTRAVEETPKSTWLAVASLFGLMGGVIVVSGVAIACIVALRKIVKGARSCRTSKRDSWSPDDV